MSIWDEIYKPKKAERDLMDKNPENSKVSIESAYLAQTIMTLFYFHPMHQHDNGDAFRHCLWSSIIAKRTSPDWALQWTNAHESDQSVDDPSRLMELSNNLKGIGLLKENPNYKISDLIFRCSELVAKGALKKRNNSELIPTTAEGFNVPSIFHVISNKVTEVVEFIANYFTEKTYEVDEDGNTALHHCIVSNYEVGFNILIDVLDVNRPGNSGETLLMVCSIYDYGYRYAQKLISKGADANFQDKLYGETALMKAATYNNIEMVEVLLPVSNVKIKSFSGSTAYDIAVNENNLSIAKLLL